MIYHSHLIVKLSQNLAGTSWHTDGGFQHGWVTHFYTDGTLVEYVRRYFSFLMNSYQDVVNLNFPELKYRLRFYQILPARAVVRIYRPPPSKDIESIGSCRYYFVPLPSGSENEVHVTLNEPEGVDVEEANHLAEVFENRRVNNQPEC